MRQRWCTSAMHRALVLVYVVVELVVNNGGLYDEALRSPFACAASHTGGTSSSAAALQSPWRATTGLYVAPSLQGGVHDPSCGQSIDYPCTLSSALEMATPSMNLYLAPGVYRGSHLVTTSVSLIGLTSPTSSSPVVFDGEHRHRPLTFDNVPAHVESVAFRNGVGESAGCLLIQLKSRPTGDVNNISRCTFTNCTGESSTFTAVTQSTSSRGVGGAIGIFYDHSAGSGYDISRVTMENNYGRSYRAASGGVAVHYAPPVKRLAGTIPATAPYCETMVLSITHESLQHAGGVYRRVKGVTYGGKPVWKSVRAANVMIPNGQLTPHLIAYCNSQKTWHLVPISPGLPTVRALHQHPPCTSSLLTSFSRNHETEPASPLQVIKWVASGGSGGAVEALRFQCQDGAQYCDRVMISQATGSQAHRNGLYYMLNVTRAGRPTFQKTFDGDRPQYIWYCSGPKEWIVSDDDPLDASDTQHVCSRGIATVETMAIHPLLVPGWRYWDLDVWRTSTGKGGIRVQCAPQEDDVCEVAELVNSPMQDFHTGPYLLLNTTWNQRPTYALRYPFSSFIWFCGTFSEWVVSETDPRTLDPNDERCSRALSSHPTQSPVPYHTFTKWAQFLDDQWIPTSAPVRIRCVDDCPRIVVDALGYGPGYKDHIGIYEGIGHAGDRRIYRKLHHGSDVYLYFNDVSQCWVVSKSLEHEDTTAVFAHACDGEPQRSVFHAVNWSTPLPPTPSSSPAPSVRNRGGVLLETQPTLSCDTHSSCRRINVSAVLYVRQEYLLGVYEPLPTLHNHRPIYVHNITDSAQSSDPKLHFMYYCAAFSKWVIGPEPPSDNRCPAWIASKSTSATHPLVNVHWVLTGDGVKWETSPVGVRMGCADDDSVRGADQAFVSPRDARSTVKGRRGEGTKADSMMTSIAHVWDVVSDCNFTGNAALSHDDTVVAAGAVLLSYGRTQVGDDPTGTIRRSSFRQNEATGPTSAGAVMIQNDYPYRLVSTSCNEVTVQENRGATGGILLSSTRASMNRVHFINNYGFAYGGAMKLLHNSNVTLSMGACRNNVARSGGCGSADASSSLSMWRSDVVNNSAMENDGTSMRGGTISITDSKVLSVHKYAISACFLMLSSSELSCSSGIPASLTDGFGCLPDPNGGDSSSGEMSTTTTVGKDSDSGVTSPSTAGLSGSSTSISDVLSALAVGIVGVAIMWYVRNNSSGGKRDSSSGRRTKR